MSFRLACSCSEGRALVMSSGKVDTIRCHPLCFFSAWVFQTALKRKEKWKGEVLTLARSWWSIGNRPEPGCINKICAPCRCVGAHPHLPEWVISSHLVFTLPWLPVSSHQAGSVHGNAVLMRALWRPPHAPTWSRHLWIFLGIYGGGDLCSWVLIIYPNTFVVPGVSCLSKTNGDNKD